MCQKDHMMKQQDQKKTIRGGYHLPGTTVISVNGFTDIL